jgi:hypothetical protein
MGVKCSGVVFLAALPRLLLASPFMTVFSAVSTLTLAVMCDVQNFPLML